MSPLSDWIESLQKYDVAEVGYTNNLNPISFENYKNWIQKDKHAPLNYLADDRLNKRESLNNYWQEARSAIVFLFSYKKTHTSLAKFYQNNKHWNGLKLASYTLGFRGFDYHEEIKQTLNFLGEELRTIYPSIQYKLVLDTQPVLERDLALRAGLGWFGKNSMLINRKHGSFTIIASLLLNQELDFPQKKVDVDHCGQCNLCSLACPTEAIDLQTRTIIARDCISTFTIEEFKLETIPSKKMKLDSGFIFGCDICQDVCPWNKRIDRLGLLREENEFSEKQSQIIDFFLKKSPSELHKDLEKMTERGFKKQFARTSFQRSGRRGLLKNVKLFLKQLNIFS